MFSAHSSPRKAFLLTITPNREVCLKFNTSSYLSFLANRLCFPLTPTHRPTFPPKRTASSAPHALMPGVVLGPFNHIILVAYKIFFSSTLSWLLRSLKHELRAWKPPRSCKRQASTWAWAPCLWNLLTKFSDDFLTWDGSIISSEWFLNVF